MAAVAEKIVVHPSKYAIRIHDPDPMPERVPPALSDVPIADTLGWDTVFAINLPHVNEALKQPGSAPGDFSQVFSSAYAIAGTFGTWQVTLGGDGEDIYLLVPVAGGTLDFNGSTYDITGGLATVMINFDYVPGLPNAAPVPVGAKGVSHKLQPKPTTSDPANQPIAAVVQFVFPEASKASGNAPTNRALVQGALTQWFIDNLERFQHVFSTVSLAEKADKASFQWLKPSLTGYAYADGTKPENSLLGVLTTTQRRSIGDLSRQISPSAIPSGAQSGFLISAELFLEQSVLPGPPHAFKNASASDYQLTNHGSEIVLAPGVSVDVNDIEYGGTTYHPRMSAFNLVINDTEIVTNMVVDVDVSPGISVTIMMTNYQTLTLVTKTDGTQTLGYKATRPPRHTYVKHVAAWVKITTAILSLLVAVIGAVVAGPGAALADAIIIGIIVAIIIGIIVGIELIIEDVITKGVAEAMPSINPMVYAATDPIVWPTAASSFTLTSAGLNGALQFGGTLNFPAPQGMPLAPPLPFGVRRSKTTQPRRR